MKIEKIIMSKEWDWEKNDKKLWLEPSMESYYYANVWKERGYSKLLDLGCGLGRHAVLFAKEGFKVTACDLSEYAVNHLVEWAKKENLSIDTKVCDMLSLPYDDETFDVIFSYHTVSHTDTVGARRIVNELDRVLKGGGEIFITLCSKETWSFNEAGYPRLDENTVIKTDDGPEKGIPHFYVDLDYVQELFGAFEILSLRHVDDIFYTDKLNHSKHYFVHLKKT